MKIIMNTEKGKVIFENANLNYFVSDKDAVAELHASAFRAGAGDHANYSFGNDDRTMLEINIDGNGLLTYKGC